MIRAVLLAHRPGNLTKIGVSALMIHIMMSSTRDSVKSAFSFLTVKPVQDKEFVRAALKNLILDLTLFLQHVNVAHNFIRRKLGLPLPMQI